MYSEEFEYNRLKQLFLENKWEELSIVLTKINQTNGDIRLNHPTTDDVLFLLYLLSQTKKPVGIALMYSGDGLLFGPGIFL